MAISDIWYQPGKVNLTPTTAIKGWTVPTTTTTTTQPKKKKLTAKGGAVPEQPGTPIGGGPEMGSGYDPLNPYPDNLTYHPTWMLGAANPNATFSPGEGALGGYGPTATHIWPTYSPGEGALGGYGYNINVLPPPGGDSGGGGGGGYGGWRRRGRGRATGAYNQPANNQNINQGQVNWNF